MKKRSKIILITSATCMGAGLLLTGAGFFLGGFPGIVISSKGLQSVSHSEEPYVLEKTRIDPVTAAELDLNCSADIEFLPSGDKNCYLEYVLDGAGAEPEWKVSSEKLTLTQDSNTRGGVFLFGTDVFPGDTDTYVRLYLPEGTELSDLDVTNDLGDISASGLSAGSLTLVSEYGNCTLEDMIITEADVELEYGDLRLEVSGLDMLNGTIEYGDATIILTDGASDHSYSLSTEFGDITLPESVSGRVARDEDGEPFFEREGSSGTSITFVSEFGNISIRDR